MKGSKEVYYCHKCPGTTLHCTAAQMKTHLKKHNIVIKPGESLARFKSVQTAVSMQQGIEGKKL